MLTRIIRSVGIAGVMTMLLLQQYTLQRHTSALMMQTAIILSQESQIRKMEQELRVMPHSPHAIPMPVPLLLERVDPTLRVL